MSIPIQKLGWMAGVIDLKGRVIRRKNKTRKTDQLSLVVMTKEFVVVRELSALTGISVEMRQASNVKDWMRRGCIEHCPEKHVHTSISYQNIMPETARWSISGTAMVIVLQEIMPYLLSNQRYIDIIQEATENSKLVNQGSGKTVQVIQRLYDLGWSIPSEFASVLDLRSSGERAISS